MVHTPSVASSTHPGSWTPLGLMGRGTELKGCSRQDGKVTITTPSVSQFTLPSTLQAAGTAGLLLSPKSLAVKGFFGNVP